MNPSSSIIYPTEIESIRQQLNEKSAIITRQLCERDELHQQVALLRDALKQARHMIYYGEPQIGWNITRIDEVIDATKDGMKEQRNDHH